MSAPVLYYITDRNQFQGDEFSRRKQLLEKISEATLAGLDYIQLREKDLSSRDLEDLARDAMRIVAEGRTNQRRPYLLINSRTDVALAVGAAGVHLRADDISPRDVRLACAGNPAALKITIACHKPEDVQQAHKQGADLAIFAPVFEKRGSPSANLAGPHALRRACQFEIPVLALGGVTLENASACLHAGAAGIAAIRLFQENRIADVVGKLLA